MLLSPIHLPESTAKPDRIRVVRRATRVPVRANARAQRDSAIPAVLLIWIVLGAALLLLAPFARSDRSLGATLPFWLVGAPLIDLLWWQRRSVAAALRDVWRARHRRRRAAAVRCPVSWR